MREAIAGGRLPALNLDAVAERLEFDDWSWWAAYGGEMGARSGAWPAR